jgi:hypothetical protein
MRQIDEMLKHSQDTGLDEYGAQVIACVLYELETRGKRLFFPDSHTFHDLLGKVRSVTTFRLNSTHSSDIADEIFDSCDDDTIFIYQFGKIDMGETKQYTVRMYCQNYN